MHEAVLRDFFVGAIGVDDLAKDLAGSVTRSRDVERFLIVDMEGEFRVEPKHLARICYAYLQGVLNGDDLKVIGFALVASDAFYFEGDTDEEARVVEVAHAWATLDLNLPITREKALRWRGLLELS